MIGPLKQAPWARRFEGLRRYCYGIGGQNAQFKTPVQNVQGPAWRAFFILGSMAARGPTRFGTIFYCWTICGKWSGRPERKPAVMAVSAAHARSWLMTRQHLPLHGLRERIDAVNDVLPTHNIGSYVPMVDGPEKVSGRGKYTADFIIP